MLHLPVGLQTSEGRDAEKEVAEETMTTTGMEFSSNISTLGMTSAAALRGRTEEQQQRQSHQVGGPATMGPTVPAALLQHEQQKTGQSVRAPNVNSLSLDKMLKVVLTVAQHLMTESNGAVLEEAIILAITNIVFWSEQTQTQLLQSVQFRRTIL
jgi:hypothetical protein